MLLLRVHERLTLLGAPLLQGKKKPRNAGTQPGPECIRSDDKNRASGGWFQGEQRLLIRLVLSGNRPEAKGPEKGPAPLTLRNTAAPGPTNCRGDFQLPAGWSVRSLGVERGWSRGNEKWRREQKETPER